MTDQQELTRISRMTRQSLNSINPKPDVDGVAEAARSGRSPSRAMSVASASSEHASPSSRHSHGAHMPSSGDAVPDADIQMGGTSAATAPKTVLTEASGVEALGEHTKQLFQLMDKLSKFGIDTTLESIPRFVVVGDQSSGKSSLIEAACNITLPRSEGTCTRCPFQIITSPATSAGWSCKISLVLEYHYVGSLQASSEVAEYNDWAKIDVPEIIHFHTVHQQHELEEHLRRAQIAILNPSRDPNFFAFRSSKVAASQATEVDFSPNVVKLEVEGPDLPNLSFFDLPGAINDIGDYQKGHLVGFVKKLVRSYIRDTGTLILLARPIDQDLEMSTASRFVKQENARDRCMGVLTKPDLLPRGRWPDISKVLENEMFKMGHGYFVTKQLSQHELDERPSHAEARRREEQFFEHSEPWSNQFAGFADRFGIWSLQRAISENFAVHVMKSMPEITTKVQHRLAEINEQLQEIPKPTASPVADVLNELATLVNVVKGCINGTYHNDADASDPFITQFRGLIRKYGERLAKLRPVFSLSTPGHQCPLRIFSIDSDEDNNDDDATVSVPTPSKKQKSASKALPVRVTTPQATPQRQRKTPIKTKQATPATRSLPTKLVLKLDDIRTKLDSRSRSRLPGRVGEEVVDNFITLSTKQWESPASQLSEKISTEFAIMLKEATNTALVSRKETLLYQRSIEILKNYLFELMKTQRSLVTQILDRERLKPVLNNAQRLKQAEAYNLRTLSKLRDEERVNEQVDLQEARTGKAITEAERKKLQDPKVPNLPAQDYVREMGVMATIHAYYDIASERIVDNLQQCFELHLLETFKNGVQQQLFQNLRVGDAQYCAELLAENPAREVVRVKLEDERERIMKAMNEINAVRMPANDFT